MIENNEICLHLKTPLLFSHELSLSNSPIDGKRRNIYLKLDNCQPSGSFKIRGIGHLIYQNYSKNNIKHVISSSGGNAGLATAYIANKLSLKATILTPTTVLPTVVEKLKSYNAEVLIHGDTWDDTDKRARELSQETESALYVSPFDHQLIWIGHSSIIDEIKEQMNGVLPDCIIASVGGGGLVLGLIEGLIRHNWMQKNIKIIAVETEGADCFNKSVKENRIVNLESISSIAKSLGAKTCAQKLFDYYLEYKENIISIVVTDQVVVETMNRFIDDHRFLVEPSCAASLAAAYNLEKYLGNKNRFQNVVVEVCGGSAITLENLLNYKKMFNVGV